MNMNINMQLTNAIQKAYTAGIEYITCLRNLSQMNLKGTVTAFDIESVNVAYAALKTAQWELNAALDGGMTSSKS